MKSCSFLVIIMIMLGQLGCVYADPLGEVFLPAVCVEGQASALKVTFNLAESEMLSGAEMILTIRPDVPDENDLSNWEWVYFDLNGFAWVLPADDFLAPISSQWRDIRVEIPSINWLKAENCLQIALLPPMGHDPAPVEQAGVAFALDPQSIAVSSEIQYDQQWQPITCQNDQPCNLALEIETTPFPSAPSNNEAALNCFLAYPTETIMPTNPVYHRLPTANQENPSIVACLGEAEPVQLVVETGSQAVENVTVRCSDMRSQSALLPASAIEIRYVGQVNCANMLWPDPLFENPDHGVDMTSQDTKAWWITVDVPADQEPGIYSGTLNTTGVGGIETQIPFVVRVYDFAFPDPLPMGVSIGLSLWPDVEPLAFDRHFFPHHNQMGTDFTRPSFHIDSQGTVTVDFTEFDESVSNLRDNWGMKQICLGFCLGDYPGDYIASTLTLAMIDQDGNEQQVSIDPRQGGEHLAMFNSILSQYEQHLAERGWLDDAFFYLWDEPQTDECTAILNEMAPFFESAAPNIDTVIVSQPIPGRYADSIDIYCTLSNHHSVECSEWIRDNNKELWYYSCGSLQNVSLTLNYPALDYRMFGWLARRFGAVHTLFWAVDLGYETVVLRPDGLSFEDCPRGGDGCVFYANPYGDVPLPSIRSENWRDGIEDAIILQMAADLLIDGKTVQQHVNELIPTQFSRNRDPRAFAELRERVYGLLDNR